ncbi:hypothetical protein BJV78DRAFT_1251324 [Lactifluus subvellereus]|nr:hypothetical protein BJV78DRAFT_1251324 [Lactifluus subvellereus]
MSAVYRRREETGDLYSRRVSLRAPPAPNPRPVLSIPPGRTADWHQRIGTCETLPPPKRAASGRSMPQPVWELRLNPDYGTLPGIPLLEALQGVGAVGANLPIYSDRPVTLNIYWPQLGDVDYEEWFSSPDIASAPLGEVACIIAELYRGLFERVGPKIKPISKEWQIRPRDDASGICFGQLRLTRLYSFDGTRIYPEIVAVIRR